MQITKRKNNSHKVPLLTKEGIKGRLPIVSGLILTVVLFGVFFGSFNNLQLNGQKKYLSDFSIFPDFVNAEEREAGDTQGGSPVTPETTAATEELNDAIAGGDEVAEAEALTKLNNAKDKAEAPPAASSASALANVIGWLLFYFATGIAYIVNLVINNAMMPVMKFNTFLDMQVVKTGWAITRDIANNFFIIILLVIAVGTILRIPNYDRKLMPKLLVMAVLINFSKMFTGIFIDFSQIITMFFANAITSVGNGGNLLLYALGLNKLYQMSSGDLSNTGWTQAIPGTEKLGEHVIRTMLFAIILGVVALVVISCITIILVYRIVMLWFLVILSPAAYFLSTFPKGQQYAGMWWSELGKYLVVGPVMLFFLYLSLFSGAVNIDNPQSKDARSGDYTVSVDKSMTSDAVGALTKMEEAPNQQDQSPFLNFLIIIGLMVGSLVAGQKIGVKGGEWAGKGVATLQKYGKKVGMAPLGATKWAGKKGLAKASTGALSLGSGLIKYSDKGLSAISGGKLGLGDSMRKVGQFGEKWRGGVLEARDTAKKEKRQKLWKKLGMNNDAQIAWGEVANSNLGRGVKLAATTATGAVTLAAGVATGGLALIPAGIASAAAFSPLLKSYVAKTEDERKKEIADSAKQKDDEVKRLDEGKDKAVGDQNKYLSETLADETRLINRNVTDRSNGNGLDQRVIDLVDSWNKKDGKNYFTDDKKIAEAKSIVYQQIEDELTALTKESIKGIEDSHGRGKESAEKNHEARVQSIGEPTWMQKKWGDYHPNKVTMNAAKEAGKEKREIKAIIDALASGSEDIHDISGDKFFTPGGQTASQTLLFKSLADNSDKSNKSLAETTKTLQKIQKDIANGLTIDKAQSNTLVRMSQGIAAFKKGGGDVSSFSQVIAELNKITTHKSGETNNKLGKTVSDWEADSTITPK